MKTEPITKAGSSMRARVVRVEESDEVPPNVRGNIIIFADVLGC